MVRSDRLGIYPIGESICTCRADSGCRDCPPSKRAPVLRKIMCVALVDWSSTQSHRCPLGKAKYSKKRKMGSRATLQYAACSPGSLWTDACYSTPVHPATAQTGSAWRPHVWSSGISASRCGFGSISEGELQRDIRIRLVQKSQEEWKHFELSLPLWSIRNWVCCFEM